MLSIGAGLAPDDAYESPYCPDGSKRCYQSTGADGTGEGFLGCCKLDQICGVKPDHYLTLECLDRFSSKSEYQACLARAERAFQERAYLAKSQADWIYCEGLYDQAELNCKASWPYSEDDSGEASEAAPPPENSPQMPDEEPQDDNDDGEQETLEKLPRSRDGTEHPHDYPHIS